ncbi:MAG: hypothetical protein SPG61_05390, partial [Arcanobacterium sp.]|nr:hypothetical protein [Arcanobacterium sp.]
LNLREKLVMGILIALMLVLGFYPAPILELVSGISEATAQLFTAGATTHAGGVELLDAITTIEGSLQ